MERKVLLITHDDLDGAGCDVVFSIFHTLFDNDGWEIIHTSNGNIDQITNDVITKIDQYSEIDFADICPSREVLEKVNNTGVLINIWDHHRTNLFATWVVSTAQIIPENEVGQMQSGTSVMYKALVEKYAEKISEMKFSINERILALFVDTVRSYDTYEWKSTNNMLARQLNVLFRLLGMDNFCNRMMKRISSTSELYQHEKVDANSGLITEDELEFVNANITNEQRTIDNFSIDDVVVMDVKGLKAAILFNSCSANTSELGNQFLEKHPDIDIFIRYSLINGGNFEIRCNKDNIDTGKLIAAPVGGGGHPKASGCPLSMELKKCIQHILCLYLNESKFDVYINVCDASST